MWSPVLLQTEVDAFMGDLNLLIVVLVTGIINHLNRLWIWWHENKCDTDIMILFLLPSICKQHCYNWQHLTTKVTPSLLMSTCLYPNMREFDPGYVLDFSLPIDEICHIHGWKYNKPWWSLFTKMTHKYFRIWLRYFCRLSIHIVKSEI